MSYFRFCEEYMIELKPHTHSITPEEFRNQVYHSDLANFEYKKYTSHYSIKYCVRGEEYYVINGREQKLSQGKYVIVNEGDQVSYFTQKQSEGFSIFLDSEIIRDITLFQAGLGDEFQSSTFFNQPLPSVDPLGTFLKNTLQPNAINYSEPYFYDLVEKIMASQSGFFRQLDSLNQVKLSTREEILRRLYQAVEFMQDTPFQLFDLNTIARIACLSKYHFTRLFKAVYGQTPWQFHFDIKMEHCKFLLCNESLSIRELSEKMGYTSIEAFSRSFKKHHGFPPSFYRK